MARHALASAAPSHTILDPDWWAAAGQRAAYTALAALLPLALLLVAGDVAPLYVLSVVALAMLASLATSLAGLPETADRPVPAWLATLVRVGKTVGQVLAANLVGAVVVSDVAWAEVWQAVAGAALVTLVRVLMTYLPETSPPSGTAEFAAISLADLDDPDLAALTAALDPGDPARAALERLGVTPVLTEQQWTDLEKVGGTE